MADQHAQMMLDTGGGGGVIIALSTSTIPGCEDQEQYSPYQLLPTA